MDLIGRLLELAMCVVEALAAGTSGGRGLRLPGGERLTAPEVAAMASGLSEPARLLLEAIQADPASGAAREASMALRRWLWLKAVDESARRGWKTVRGQSRCEWLAEIVRDELLAGEGFRVSGRQAARHLRIADPTYLYGPWPARLDWLRGVGDGLLREIRRGLEQEIYGCAD